MRVYDNVLRQSSGGGRFGNAILFLLLFISPPLKLLRKTYNATFKDFFAQILVNLSWRVSDHKRLSNNIRHSTSFIAITCIIYFNKLCNMGTS